MKYKLVIPEQFLPVTHPTIVSLDHDIYTEERWESRFEPLLRLGWLVKVIDPMSKEESFEVYRVVSCDLPSVKDFNLGWAEGRRNLLLEQGQCKN